MPYSPQMGWIGETLLSDNESNRKFLVPEVKDKFHFHTMTMVGIRYDAGFSFRTYALLP